MQYFIKDKTNVTIGVLPSNQMMDGSSDIGDVMNSWIIYTNYCLASVPTHQLSVMSTIAGDMVKEIIMSASSFEISVTDKDFEYEDIITFKGKEYYVVDSIPDEELKSFTLEIVNRKLHDLETAETTRDEATTDNLDALWSAVQTRWARGAATQTAKVVETGPITARPAVGIVAAPDAYANANVPHQRADSGVRIDAGNGIKVPVSMGFVSQTRAPVSDIAAAQQALHALLAKGRL